MEVKEAAILEIVCDEWDHEHNAYRRIVRSVYPLRFTPQNLQKFWDKAKEFPTLYGREILDNPQEFYSLIMSETPDGSPIPNGLFWVVDDFVGIFYITDIDVFNKDAHVHYTFFDKRTKGRLELVKGMIKYVFNKYPFQRLSAPIPLYTSKSWIDAEGKKKHENSTIRFALDLGFYYEGKKRKAAFYKNEWFDINLYGILRNEALRR